MSATVASCILVRAAAKSDLFLAAAPNASDATSDNGYENEALFGYDDKALSSMTWFSHR
ncbi:hypothetical protein ACWCQS_37065 [Streptomyces sp. NPDC002076]